MIDLNQKPKQEADDPVGKIILYFLPIMLVFFTLFIRGL